MENRKRSGVSHQQMTHIVFLLVTSLMTSLTTAQCPAQCRCVQFDETINPGKWGQGVDCASREIGDLAEIFPLDPSTSVLDLRSNKIKAIKMDAFALNQNLTTILLDDNEIESIEGYAFRGLHQLEIISLTGNALRRIKSNTFSEITGRDSSCIECGIFLEKNGIDTIERHAFAWMKGLRVSIGESDTPLHIQAYAFYGACAISRLQIGRVPSLTIRPRIFTNAENIDSLEISETSIDHMDGFVFEGLKNVKSITFRSVEIKSMAAFVLSGISFSMRREKNEETDVNEHKTVHQIKSGGRVTFDECRLQYLPSDAFRDTNLAMVVVRNTWINRTAGFIFRGANSLQAVLITGSTLNTLAADSLGSMRNVREIHLDDNEIRTIDAYAFRDTTDVSDIRIRVVGNLTLHTDAFSHVLNVRQIKIQGSAAARSRLIIDERAFQNLVGVDFLQIANINVPALTRYSFAGLSKIKNLIIKSCNVSRVDRLAFGDAYSHMGAIESLDLSAANNLTCECRTTAELARDFQQRFTEFSVVCHTPENKGSQKFYIDEISGLESSLACNANAASTGAIVLAHLITFAVCFLLHQLGAS